MALGRILFSSFIGWFRWLRVRATNAYFGVPRAMGWGVNGEVSRSPSSFRVTFSLPYIIYSTARICPRGCVHYGYTIFTTICLQVQGLRSEKWGRGLRIFENVKISIFTACFDIIFYEISCQVSNSKFDFYYSRVF